MNEHAESDADTKGDGPTSTLLTHAPPDEQLSPTPKISDDEEMEELLFRPLVGSRKIFYVVVGVLLAVIGLGVYAYYVQYIQGLIVTGMGDYVSWGVYISSFVFFIGISHVGALMSAILRLTNAEWRIPLTRIAEAITACSLAVGATLIIIDMGRPDRILNVVIFGRVMSPIFWDMIAITSYLTASLVFLYIPMIPDIALCRDKLKNVSRWRKTLYRWMSLGWKGTEEQNKRLHKAMFALTVAILPLAISVHTVVSWIFGMTMRTGWNSTIFAPYFVVGALYSGVATVLMAMYVFRYVYRLEKYIKYRHFRNLALILLVLSISYMYFTLSEYLTVAYKMELGERDLLAALFVGDYALVFWTSIIVGMIIPAFIISIPKTRTVKGIVIAATMVNIGMWTKRYVITVPSLANPLLPYEWGVYSPTWVEWSIIAASFAAFMLLFIIFAKLFPIISIWEMKEHSAGKSTEESVPEKTPAPYPIDQKPSLPVQPKTPDS